MKQNRLLSVATQDRRNGRVVKHPRNFALPYHAGLDPRSGRPIKIDSYAKKDWWSARRLCSAWESTNPMSASSLTLICPKEHRKSTTKKPDGLDAMASRRKRGWCTTRDVVSQRRLIEQSEATGMEAAGTTQADVAARAV